MNPLKALTLPEYLFRPRQILVRLKRSFAAPAREVETVVLPWGARVSIRPREVIGARLWYYGIFDMEVAELIFRLLEAGETALDIGANIGVMTTLMCAKAGKHGTVVAFEPHPKVFEDLKNNVAGSQSSEGPTLRLHPLALSDKNDEGVLEEGPDWEENRGTARITSDRAAGAGRFAVRLAPLDSIIGANLKCHLAKVDVEGHELGVFKGAESLLSRRQLRDIIFEDRDQYPTHVQNLLRKSGYELFSVHKRLFGPALCPLRAQPEFQRGIEGENFLATLEPQRAIERCRAKGWKVLAARPGDYPG
jgi:FkbM family methyltransferase